MRKLIAVGALAMVLAAPAMAVNVVVNGNFTAGETGWTRWNSSWGGPFTWTANPGDGNLVTGSGSFGWWQSVPTTPGQLYTITATWRSPSAPAGLQWAETLFFNDDGRAMILQLDAPANSSVISKHDGWGMNGGMTFGPEPITAAYFPAGPLTNTIVATADHMFVGLKAGTVGDQVNVHWADVIVTPEPASMLLLGIPLLLLRRRHA